MTKQTILAFLKEKNRSQDRMVMTSVKEYIGAEEYMEMLRNGEDFGEHMGNNQMEQCSCCGMWADSGDYASSSGQTTYVACDHCLVTNVRSQFKKKVIEIVIAWIIQEEALYGNGNYTSTQQVTSTGV